MEPLACAIAATAAIYLFASFTFAFAFVRRQTDADYGVLALMCVVLAEYAFGGFLGSTSRDDGGLHGAQIGWMGLVAAFAMLVHFALRYAGTPRSMRFLIPMYTIAFVFEWLDAQGELHDAVAARATHLATFGGDLVFRAVPMTRLGVVACALCAVAAGFALVSFARTYLAGKREALAFVIGTTALFATTLADAASAAGWIATSPLVNAGFVVFVMSASTTIGARYAAASAELDERSADLRARRKELQRAHAELQSAREELSHKEQLAVVGELAAVIAHEVRNPLAIISNAVANLRKPSTSPEDRETMLTILDEETSRLNRLVRDLLRYARPVNLQKTYFALHDLLERALAMFRTRRGLTVDFVVECSPDECKIWGDNNLLRQVFDNLVDNAVQAMGAIGTLTVKIRTMRYDGVDGVAVEVTDTGEGMDTQVRSRARDPFFTTRPSGTGLGLAIVDRIVEAHGGRFFIESMSGEGTTVTVFLPYGSSREEEAEVPLQEMRT